jgi:secretion/DNA translocation related TadE-like protein
VRRSPARGESGAATLLVLMLLGLVVVVGVAAVAGVALVVTHRTAQAGADLAALAGARAVQDGQAPCEVAARIARRNRTELTGCGVDGFEVRVAVAARARGLPGGAVTLRARAHAGPVSALRD